MTRRGIICILLLITVTHVHAQRDVTKYVNPFVGTAPLLDPKIIGYSPNFNAPNSRVWAGLTFPGASLPNAMVQLSPITEYGSGAGYEYEDTVIYGFAHTNKGHWNLCNIPILPATGPANANGKYSSRFSKASESAGPGFYNVFLKDYKVQVNLTSTLRAGFHRYTYSSPDGKEIIFDLSRANNKKEKNKVYLWDIEQAGKNAVQGYQEVGGDKIYFYASITEDIADFEKIDSRKEDGLAVIKLKDGKNTIVELKIGLSFVSTQNAHQNLDSEIGNRSFESVKSDAHVTWEQLLSKIRVKGGSEKQRQLFYSSLYRSFLWPALRSDVNGEYTDVKGTVIKADFNYYTVPSLWDDFHNKLVLLEIISPKVTGDVIRSISDMGSKTGFMPTFFHGDHAASFVAGAYLRGVKGFDVQEAYRLLLRNATVEGAGRPHLDEYKQKGYISEPDIAKPTIQTIANAGVTKTLEYAYDDYSLSLLAKELGDSVNYKNLRARSKNYKNVFDHSVNFMRGRLSNGDWIKPFNEQSPYNEYMYREANAWQVSFFALHDMSGLISLYGGNNAFESKLDSFFTIPWDPKYIEKNMTGFIGQYCHGNQPDHEAPFSYYFIGKPEKSQKVLDDILNNLYGLGEDGLALCGMDDAGEMSSWYVFNAMGLYPFSPSDPHYIVSVPLFDEVKWKLDNGKELTINSRGGTRTLRSIEVNRKAINGYFVRHDLFLKGGQITVNTK